MDDPIALRALLDENSAAPTPSVLGCEHKKPACWSCLDKTKAARELADAQATAARPDIMFATNWGVLHSIDCRHVSIGASPMNSAGSELFTRDEALNYLAQSSTRRRCRVCCPDIEVPASLRE
jgi:hypothetical protein